MRVSDCLRPIVSSLPPPACGLRPSGGISVPFRLFPATGRRRETSSYGRITLSQRQRGRREAVGRAMNKQSQEAVAGSQSSVGGGKTNVQNKANSSRLRIEDRPVAELPCETKPISSRRRSGDRRSQGPGVRNKANSSGCPKMGAPAGPGTAVRGSIMRNKANFLVVPIGRSAFPGGRACKTKPIQEEVGSLRSEV